MSAATASGPDDLGWASVEGCTLPTPERPLRLAQFDDLFATTLQSVERPGETHARLVFAGDDTLPTRVQRLADAESSCCSFFTFTVSTVDGDRVALDIDVPPAYAEVLAGLTGRAEAARGDAP